MLRLEHVYKSYSNDNYVLKDISIDFAETGLVTILGASGCGKSTLLNLIGLLDKPSEGKVYYRDKDLSTLNKKQIDYYHAYEIGFIYQQYNLIDHMTVKDNIELRCKSNNLDIILNSLGILELKDKKVKYLSGGQMQRVAIARALVNNPNILICDEPTGALDSQNRIEIMEYLKRISKTKLVIIVSHDEELSNKYSDRIIRLKDGVIVDDTSKEVEVFHKPFIYRRVKVKLMNILRIVNNNFTNKLKRNLLISLAFSISLISLLLVLGISNGFKDSIETNERDNLSKYPIYISESSTNYSKELKDAFKDKQTQDGYVYTNDSHKNKINKKYIKNLDQTDLLISNKILTFNLNGYYYQYMTNYDDLYKTNELVSGSYLNNKYDVLLVVDKDGVINKELLNSIGIKKKKISYEDIVGYKYKINNKKYKICGIIKINDDSIYNSISGLFYNNNLNKIPLEIYLFPKDYNSKNKLLKILDNYKGIEYTDYSTAIKEVSITLMDALTVVLLVFSGLSLLVTIIMIGIITYISVIEKIHEIGIYKTLGINNKYIKRIFYLENNIISIIACIISLIFILIIKVPFNNIIYKYTGLSDVLIINNKILLMVLLLALIISMFGSFIPLKKVNKLNVINILKM
jgi:ABC-type lipoprotein export system ATPase subunit/ABC-type lipoprotein release transport system permease subunit